MFKYGANSAYFMWLLVRYFNIFNGVTLFLWRGATSNIFQFLAMIWHNMLLTTRIRQFRCEHLMKLQSSDSLPHTAINKNIKFQPSSATTVPSHYVFDASRKGEPCFPAQRK